MKIEIRRRSALVGCEIPEREVGIRPVGEQDLHGLLVLTQNRGDQRGEALGSRIPDYRNVMTRYALELKGQAAVTDPSFEVTEGMLATILQGLRAAGVEMADSTFFGARNLIGEQFGYELTRYAFGRAAELRRLAFNDNQIAKAIELLQSATTQEDLFALAARAR